MNSKTSVSTDYHDSRDTSTFLFAPEIECALIAIAWHEPERLAQVKRELDPVLHFIQPHCRYLLEAIDLAYRDLGSVEFASVIQVLRELRRLEDCGGLEGAAAVWREGDFLDSPVWRATDSTDVLFNEYLALLKTYAINRKLDPPRPTYWFTGGKGTLLPNKVKRSDNDPDFIGEARIYGRSYVAKAWMATDGLFINFRLEPAV